MDIRIVEAHVAQMVLGFGLVIIRARARKLSTTSSNSLLILVHEACLVSCASNMQLPFDGSDAILFLVENQV